MEDYKKKYEEALERAKFYCGRGKDLEFDAPDIASDIFPELKESEDDIMRKMAIHAVYSPEAQSCIKSWGINPSDVIAWLEKQGEQKPAWSEEDEKYFNVIYKELESYIAIKGYYTPLSCADLNWLKSLKERYTWKPSNEQIKGIKCAIKTLQHQLNVGDKRLDSLYDDLKKLREE